ncbi:GcrA family cell cycle regulator [Rhizorhabdus histidinilytica]
MGRFQPRRSDARSRKSRRAAAAPGPDTCPGPRVAAARCRGARPRADDAAADRPLDRPGRLPAPGPGEQSSPIPPAPPRRLVPAKPSAEMADKTSLLDLNDKVCKWPLGHPGEPDFHFCGEPINPGFPYCLEHCSVAYQAQLPRRDRRPPPPLPFGGPRVR